MYIANTTIKHITCLFNFIWGNGLIKREAVEEEIKKQVQIIPI